MDMEAILDEDTNTFLHIFSVGHKTTFNIFTISGHGNQMGNLDLSYSLSLQWHLQNQLFKLFPIQMHKGSNPTNFLINSKKHLLNDTY